MKKDEIKKIAERFRMKIIRNPITSEGCGVTVTTDTLISELDRITERDPFAPYDPVQGTREAVGEKYIYKIFCPKSWFDLWGWK